MASEIIPILAQVVWAAPTADVPDDDLARINAFVSKPLSAKDVFVFPAIMATDQLTSYSTHLMASSLRNFSSDAQAGRPYLLDHNTDGGIYGYTYAGHFDDAAQQARAAVYIPRGRYPLGEGNSKSTDDEINDIMLGMRREVSVGFGGPHLEWVCDICNTRLFDADCDHLPGMRDRKSDTLCTAGVENARLMELSGVFKGACPGAIVGKAQKLYASRQFAQREWRDWLDLNEVADPTRTIFIPTTTPEAPSRGANQEKPMREKLAALAAKLGYTRMAVSVLSTAEGNEEQLASAIETGLQSELDARTAEHPIVAAALKLGIDSVEKLTDALAMRELGERYAKQVREEAKQEAVRAYGETDGPVIGAQVDTLGIDQVLILKKAWETDANRKFDIGENGAERLSAGRELPNQRVAIDSNPASDETDRLKQLMAMTATGRKALQLKEGK